MLKHTGARRTHIHNVRLAVLLSLTAGLVNAEGLLGFSALTTNVTGHAAIFAEFIYLKNWNMAWVVAIWMLLFLAGAFFSSFITDLAGEHQRYSKLVPVSIEIAILILIAVLAGNYKDDPTAKQVFTGSLLFAMGLQNALVSMISKSVVRTTHLTGTFTDLGIELAKLRFVDPKKKATLQSGIALKLYIIGFFITGVLCGAYSFGLLRFRAFLIPAFILIWALLYDVFRVHAKLAYRKIGKTIKI
jgi:uncharacterized membrane protein YoaK (UPF0700 family)